MVRLFATILCFSLCALGAVAGGSKFALKAEGIWTAVGGNADGKVIPDAVMADRIFVVTMKEGKYRFSMLGKEVEAGTYKIVATKTLSQWNIDLTVTEGKNKGKTRLGLVRIGGSRLVLAFPNGDKTERPKGINPADGIEITTFKRDE